MPPSRTADPRAAFRVAPPQPRGSAAHVWAHGAPRHGPGGSGVRARPPSQAAGELLLRLPADLLRTTAHRCPHLLEAIARDWAHPARLDAMLDTLIHDERRGRAALPEDVLIELADLRACRERESGPRTTPGR